MGVKDDFPSRASCTCSTKRTAIFSSLRSIPILGNVIAGFQDGCQGKKQEFSVPDFLFQFITNSGMPCIHIWHVQELDKH